MEDRSVCLWLSMPLLSLGPFLALLYTICVWLTYAINGEIPWSSKGTAMSIRLSLLVVSVAIALGLCHQTTIDKQDNVNQSILNSNNTWSILVLAVATILLGGISVYCMVQTRQNDVVGISKVPFYGSQSLKGKLILITGANNGIGKETAHQLALMGATVVLLCRSVSRAESAVQELLQRSTTSNNISKQQFVIIPLDLGDFASIHAAVKIFKDRFPNQTVDVLINNAGLMMGNPTLSNDGLELMMQANHLGHFLLTKLLLDQKLLPVANNSGSPSRVINLTSSTYTMSHSRGGFDFQDMFCDKGIRPYTLFGQYSMTKLANILFTKQLSRKYETQSLQVFAVHPGIVRTNVTSNMNWYWRIPNDLFAIFVAMLQKTPAEGAYSTVFVAAAPEADLPPSGSYIVNCQAHPTLAIANSLEDAQQLWKVSEELVNNCNNKDKSLLNQQTKKGDH
ncbi:short chain dehydrogenase/reductase oxidoreductase [Nitzschia inconspicua]|uniref:Short chain dehydrogenase/reductase oxidoreductase n=1 Tax=Nitzschia inconspicua TaxID=303405 RepID=A0A9K3PBL6_9STRA|nr:short chain dehydrogenase/reductase oxidoreductase [Nitzschia inconspicua]